MIAFSSLWRGARQVALGLEQLEGRREADGEALLLGLEALLGELARLAGGFDALQVGVDLAAGVAHLPSVTHLELAQVRELLLRCSFACASAASAALVPSGYDTLSATLQVLKSLPKTSRSASPKLAVDAGQDRQAESSVSNSVLVPPSRSAL